MVIVSAIRTAITKIFPVKAKVFDPMTEKETEIFVDHDDGIRDSTTKSHLSGTATFDEI